MKKKLCIWEDEEVKTLFKFVEVKKSEGMPLIKIFGDYAKCVGRCQNSVRNYYYKEIKELTLNKKRQKELGIELKKHIAKEQVPFSQEENKVVIGKIIQMVNNGYSVRRACLEIAGGDATKMIRYQNKYRAQIKNKVENENMDNVIKMPEKRTIMGDEDIKALFMGLLKLVKRQESLKARDTYEIKEQQANEKLRHALAEIVIKSEKIEKLQAEIKLLKSEIETSKRNKIMEKIKIADSKAKELIKQFVSKKNENLSSVYQNNN